MSVQVAEGAGPEEIEPGALRENDTIKWRGNSRAGFSWGLVEWVTEDGPRVKYWRTGGHWGRCTVRWEKITGCWRGPAMFRQKGTL